MRSSVAAISLAVLLASSAIAQQPTLIPAPQERPLSILQPTCPIGFTAQANSLSRMARTLDGADRTNRQAVSLQFHNKDGHSLTSATIVVHGANQTGLYLETSGSPEKKESRSFRLTPTAWQDGSARDKVIVNGITVLRSAEVTEMQFADGTVWHPTAFSACRAQLNGFRLIPGSAQK